MHWKLTPLSSYTRVFMGTMHQMLSLCPSPKACVPCLLLFCSFDVSMVKLQWCIFYWADHINYCTSWVNLILINKWRRQLMSKDALFLIINSEKKGVSLRHESKNLTEATWCLRVICYRSLAIFLTVFKVRFNKNLLCKHARGRSVTDGATDLWISCLDAFKHCWTYSN